MLWQTALAWQKPVGVTMFMRLLISLLLLLSSPLLAFDHSGWDTLLKKHVSWQRNGVASAVNYEGIAAERAALKKYLNSLSAVSADAFSQFSNDQQLAFLINAYNAYTIELILREPVRPDSIRDIGTFFSGPWDQRFFTLLGQKRTLDEVEHTLIRGNPNLKDPRIHFAVNCASIGCPALRPEAFVGDQLEQQLADSTQRFLRDRERNRYNSETDTLEVSKIFDWYQEDFAESAGSLSLYLQRYANILDIPENRQTALREGSIKVRFLPYNWSLNGQ
jgi:hypothetical protein